MAAQPETSLEFALTNYEFRQQYGPPTGGYDDREYSIILILLDYAQFTLNLQQHGNGGSIQPNPVAYMHMRDKLERSSGLLLDIAFNTFHDDYSARYKAVDVMQTLGVMPKAAAVARYARQLVDLLCYHGRFMEYADHLMITNGQLAEDRLCDWLSGALDTLPTEVLVQHTDVLVALIKRESTIHPRRVNMAVTLFRKLPPSVIATHASTFLDILQDDSQWGPDHCIRNNTVDLLRNLKCERMGVMGATYLEKLLSIQKTIIDAAMYDVTFVRDVLDYIMPEISLAEHADLIVACLSDEDLEASLGGDEIRSWAITILSRISIEEHADVIAACVADTNDSCQLCALNALCTLGASLANYLWAISATLNILFIWEREKRFYGDGKGERRRTAF